MAETNQEILSLIRTLLAYERNILSLERTQLAQLRTGITLALITPSAIATLAYAFEFLPKDYIVSVIVYAFLVAITFYGVGMTVKAYFDLRRTKETKKKIKTKLQELNRQFGINESPLGDILT